MSFLDQVRDASQVPPDGNPQGGMMGLATRPKQRYLDKVLMKQRDRRQQDAQGGMGQGGGANLFSQSMGQPVMPPAALGNIFSGGR